MALPGAKDVSKININDIDLDLEYEDEIDDQELDQLASKKHKYQARRKIENLIEKKRLRKMMYTEDSYWED
ncbi:MAG: hypothetical protein OEY09_04680 [Gammaproteobacteria bacterium]|nr:hypothetical protein [Gammaproteobacteria bacterium]